MASLYKQLTAVIIASILLSSCSTASPEDELIPEIETTQQVLPVEVYIPEQEHTKAVFSTKGTVTALKEVDITAIEQGTISSLLVQVGSEVNIGDPIAIMDTENSANMLPLQISNMSASISNLRQNSTLAEQSLNQNIEIARLGHQNALLNLERTKQQQIDTEKNLQEEIIAAELAVKNAEDQIVLGANVAETAVLQAKTALQNAEENTRASKEYLVVDTQNAFDRVILATEQNLDQINSILGLEWPYEHAKDKANSLGTLDPQLQNDTNWTYGSVKAKFRDLKNKQKERTLEENLAQTKLLMQDLKVLVEYLDRLPGTSIANTKLSATDITNFASVFSTLKNGQNSPYQFEQQIIQLQQALEEHTRQSNQTLTQARLAVTTAEQNLANARQESSTREQSIAVQNAKTALDRLKVRIEGERNTMAQAIANAELQVEQAKAQINVAEQQKVTQLQSLQTQLTELEGQRDLLTARTNNLIITSPSAGVVVTTAVSQGSSVNPGTVLATIVDPKDRKLIVEVTQAQAERIEFTTANVGEEVLSLSGGSPVLSEASRMRSFEYTLPSTNTLPFGSIVEVDFQYMLPSSTFLIPISYTYISNGLPSVFIVENGVAKSKVITKHQIVDEYILVEEGITHTDQIITTRSPYLEENTPVTITPQTNDN